MSNEKPALVDNSIQLQNYNHKPSVKLQHKLKLKRLAKISSTEAKEITSKICNEPVVYQKLSHKGQLLFYLNITKHCAVKVNALDGTIISKVIKK
jgi:hypothetical protein